MSDRPSLGTTRRGRAAEVAAQLRSEKGRYKDYIIGNVFDAAASRNSKINIFEVPARTFTRTDGTAFSLPKMTFYNYSNDKIKWIDNALAVLTKLEISGLKTSLSGTLQEVASSTTNLLNATALREIVSIGSDSK